MANSQSTDEKDDSVRNRPMIPYADEVFREPELLPAEYRSVLGRLGTLPAFC